MKHRIFQSCTVLVLILCLCLSLTGCSKLVRVDVYGNQIDSVEALTNQSIIVNYNPTA